MDVFSLVLSFCVSGLATKRNPCEDLGCNLVLKEVSKILILVGDGWERPRRATGGVVQ